MPSKTRLICATVLCAALYPAAAHAFRISPLVTEVDAEPGKSYTVVIDVGSSATAPEQVHIYIQDWDKLPNGEEQMFKDGSPGRGCGKWAALSQSNVTPSGPNPEKLKLSFTVPESASGTYWTAIVAEGVNDAAEARKTSSAKQSTNIDARLVYITKLLVTVKGGGAVEGSISGIGFRTAQATASNTAPAQILDVTVHNSGNIVLKPKGYIEVRDMDGNTLAQIDIPQQNIVLPLHDRIFSAQVNPALAPGEYIALAVLDYGGENLVAGEKHFEVPGAETNARANGLTGK